MTILTSTEVKPYRPILCILSIWGLIGLIYYDIKESKLIRKLKEQATISQ